MDLWYAPTSPFARKVRIVAVELGVGDAIRLVKTDPWHDSRLRQLNPLAKVPTLVLQDGEVVWESSLIAERLEFLAGRCEFFPPPGPGRWRALSIQALADGACTAAGRLFADETRRSAQVENFMTDRFNAAIAATLDRLEAEELQELATIGEISAATLMGYLDFRWPHRNWREGRPRLAGWFEQVSARPSLLDTPHALSGA